VRWMKKGSRDGAFLSKGALWGEPGNLEGGIFLLGNPKNMLSKALEMGVCFHRGSAFGEHGRTFFS
jgi:hypothetical protein